MNTIEIKGRTFTVERKKPERVEDMGRDFYVLTGESGSRYCTMRNHHDPCLMFLVRFGATGDRNFSSQMNGVWLTDRSDALEVCP